MGASCWHYSTPYDSDPELALQRLRNEVFKSGRYGKYYLSTDVFSQLRGASFGAKLIVFVYWVVSRLVYLASKAIHGFYRPRTIEEALRIAGASGTHSILDIEQCSQIHDLLAASELRPVKRREIFGTEHPTTEDLDRVGWATPAEDLQHQAVYFPIYRDGEPVLLVFVGSSGD